MGCDGVLGGDAGSGAIMRPAPSLPRYHHALPKAVAVYTESHHGGEYRVQPRCQRAAGLAFLAAQDLGCIVQRFAPSSHPTHPPPTPLLPALTLSAGEHQVSTR